MKSYGPSVRLVHISTRACPLPLDSSPTSVLFSNLMSRLLDVAVQKEVAVLKCSKPPRLYQIFLMETPPSAKFAIHTPEMRDNSFFSPQTPGFLTQFSAFVISVEKYSIILNHYFVYTKLLPPQKYHLLLMWGMQS